MISVIVTCGVHRAVYHWGEVAEGLLFGQTHRDMMAEFTVSGLNDLLH